MVDLPEPETPITTSIVRRRACGRDRRRRIRRIGMQPPSAGSAARDPPRRSRLQLDLAVERDAQSQGADLQRHLRRQAFRCRRACRRRVRRVTACSISRCELTPTIFRNLRMLMLSASSSMANASCGLSIRVRLAPSGCVPTPQRARLVRTGARRSARHVVPCIHPPQRGKRLWTTGAERRGARSGAPCRPVPRQQAPPQPGARAAARARSRRAGPSRRRVERARGPKGDPARRGVLPLSRR